MDKFSLRSDFRKDAGFSKSSANADDGKDETSDSALMNQSIIISGNVNSVNREILDVSNNYTSDELNTNIDALMPDKKAFLFEEKDDVESLSGKQLKCHCTDEPTCPIPCNKSDLNKSNVDTVEVPEVEITSREESNGKFRVKFHIKGFGKI